MIAETHVLNMRGELLRCGFWLYVWEITPPRGTKFYCVGRTGDSSSSYAQSPFNRMGQHLGFNEKSNILRRQLVDKGIAPDKCVFRLVAHGPILKEATKQDKYRQARDITAAFEKALADAAGYGVINTVRSRKPLDEKKFANVRATFAARFRRLVGRT